MTHSIHTLAIVSVSIGIISMLIMLVDIIAGNKQHMKIMNVVWPITGLYAGPLALLAYYFIGRKSTHKTMMSMHAEGMNKMPGMQRKDEGNKHNMKMPPKPLWQSVVVGALHCGSGCTLGDLIAETLLLYIPISLFGSTLYGGWLLDFILAFILGIIFQYYAIKPMKKLSPGEALKAALKADALSLTAWQVGMYGGMAIFMFIILKQRLNATQIVFWMVMQVAMVLGFFTAYPVNWWLIKTGIKEKM